MRRLKSLFLILLVLILPMQAAASAAMPWPGSQEQAGLLPSGEACALHDTATLPDTAAQSVSDAAPECDNCRLCHLAASGFLLAPATLLPEEATSVQVAFAPVAMPSHIGDPPYPPPRRTN